MLSIGILQGLVEITVIGSVGFQHLDPLIQIKPRRQTTLAYPAFEVTTDRDERLSQPQTS
jgi:hypothetical protein